MSLIKVAKDLAKDLEPLKFGPPVTHVYNPLIYAWRPHQKYLEKYGQGAKEVLLFGMNPGPFGMAQTGVPFGEIAAVRDWLGIEAKVDKPSLEHPKRPVDGFACKRSEVSGARVWSWARDTFGTADKFFERFFIANYCPLAFMEESGKNRTPDKLPANEREPLLAACDKALRRTIEILQPKYIIGIGTFAEDRAKTALHGLDLKVGRLLHPSPASPLANRGWAEAATAALRELGIKV